MPALLAFIAVALLALPALARPPVDPCAQARDPVRCAAHQTAQRACAAMRGKEQRNCIEVNMPPLDCRRMQDQSRCEAQQNARELCRSKAGKDLSKCLSATQPAKRRKPPAATGSGAGRSAG